MSSVLRGNARRRRPFRRVNRRIGTPTYGGVGAAGREPRWLPNPFGQFVIAPEVPAFTFAFNAGEASRRVLVHTLASSRQNSRKNADIFWSNFDLYHHK